MNPITRAVQAFQRVVQASRRIHDIQFVSADPVEAAAVLADALQDIDARLERLEDNAPLPCSPDCTRQRVPDPYQEAAALCAILNGVVSKFRIIGSTVLSPHQNLVQAVEGALEELAQLRIDYSKLSKFKNDVAYELGAERNPDLALDALKARLSELKELKEKR